MKRTSTISLILVAGLLTLSPAHAQQRPPNAGAAAPLLDVGLDALFTDYELVDLDLDALARQRRGARRITIPLAGVERAILLVPNDLRAPSYRVTVSTDAGLVEEQPRPAATFKGTVEGDAASDVRLLVEDGLVAGYVRTQIETLFVEPAAGFDRRMPRGRMVVYREADVRPEHRGACGSLELLDRATALAREMAAAPAKTGADDVRIVEIATDADFEFVRAHGSSANAVVEGIVNQVDGILRSELNVGLTIAHQHTWATANDPYTTSNPKRLLRQFKKEWNRSGGAGDGVSRDAAHLFTGRDLAGSTAGNAFVGVVCADPANAYAISQTSATSTLVKTVAHQLGHNLGVASHDDERGASACAGDGPLMCTEVQTAGPNVFSDASKNDVRNYVATYGACLEVEPGPGAPRRVRGDFDGDGKADFSIKSDQVWLVDLASNGFGAWDFELRGFGFANARAVPADYDGDGKTDVSLKGDDGVWVIDFASNGFAGTDVAFAGYGFSNVEPVPADYDGDGRADLSVKSNDGFWGIDYAANGFGVWDLQLTAYGNATAHPVPADYDGDGRADLSVKVDDGFWLIDFASDGFGRWNAEFASYGDASAHPVPEDYDGDGKVDLSVKTDNGEWFIDFAAGGFGPGTDFASYRGYGFENARPIPLDYDGDGTADLSVKTDDGYWFIDYASNGFGVWDLERSGYGTLPPVVPGR